MISDMRIVTISKRGKVRALHIEAPGCIVNIHVGLSDDTGREVTSVSVLPDGNRYAGDPEWWIETEGVPRDGVTVRIVQQVVESV